MMISGESPAMLFDLVMTRFEATYNPHLIYDASCLAKEYSYNRALLVQSGKYGFKHPDQPNIVQIDQTKGFMYPLIVF